MTHLPPIDTTLRGVLVEEAGQDDADAPTVLTALGIIDDARALVDGLVDHVLPTLRHSTDDHMRREALVIAGERVAAAWADLVIARTMLEDLR